MKRPYRWHILICKGDKCSTGGSDEIARLFTCKLRVLGIQAQFALKQARAQGREPSLENLNKLELWQQVKLSRVGCLDECESGPMTVVYPGGAWYARLTPEQIELVIQKHLLNGESVQDLLYYLQSSSDQVPAKV